MIVLSMVILCSCAAPHKGHPLHIQNVTNYARAIQPTKDFAVLHEWQKILKEEPVISGKGFITWDKVKELQNKYKEYEFQHTYEYWQNRKEFQLARKGDCKSFAISLYKDLREAGAKARQLNLWSGDYDGTPHLILVIDIKGEERVLDIMNPTLPLAKDYFYKHFQPAYRFNENGWDVN